MFSNLGKGLRKISEELKRKVVTRKLTERDIDQIFSDVELLLLRGGVAVETIERLRETIKEKLLGLEVSRRSAEDKIRELMEEAIYSIIDTPRLRLEELVKKKRKRSRPCVILFVGFNGTGKSLTVAKIANYLKNRGFRVLIAAADTYRAAGIEQMTEYAKGIGVPVVRQNRGADSAAVIFDAVKKAQTRFYDVVCADTAGRVHSDENLLEELRKTVRVNKPDLKVLVVDGLAGNDALYQCKYFNGAIDVDCTVITKMDATDKGGVILTVADCLRKPILFLGVGQGYSDLVEYKPKVILKQIFEEGVEASN